MPGIAPGTATDIWARDQQQVYTLLFVFLNRAPKWIFLRVIKQKLPGFGNGNNYLRGQIHQVGISIDY